MSFDGHTSDPCPTCEICVICDEDHRDPETAPSNRCERCAGLLAIYEDGRTLCLFCGNRTIPDRTIRCPGCDCEPVGYAPHNGQGDCPPKGADRAIRCDYCGDALPSVKSRSDALTTPDLQRLGFAADTVVCPECVAFGPSVMPEGAKRIPSAVTERTSGSAT